MDLRSVLNNLSTIPTIAKELDITNVGVSYWINKLGIKPVWSVPYGKKNIALLSVEDKQRIKANLKSYH